MQRLKRIWLLLITNFFIMIGIYVVLFILEQFFGIKIGWSRTWLLIMGAVIGFGGALVSLWMSRAMAKRMYSIQLIDNSVRNYDQVGIDSHKINLVYQTVSNISQAEHIPIPEVGYYISTEPNAFATGPSKSSSLVAVSSWLLEKMTEDEIRGVVAHEMTHILNGDMVTMTLLQGVMNTFVFFLARVAAWFGSDDEDGGGYNFFLALILEILFGILWSIVVNQFSQYREFRADAGSAKLLGEKNSMIKALQKLQIITRELDTNSDQLATMKIFWHGWWLMRLFATHPSLEKRIAALESI